VDYSEVGLKPWIDVWLAAALFFPLLALPSRHLLWLFVGVVGTPVLSWALMVIAAQVTDDPVPFGRLHRWMLIIALAEVLLWLLWRRLRSWRRPPAPDPGSAAIDLAAAALLFTWARHLFDPFVRAMLPGARWTTTVPLPQWALSLLIPLTVVLVIAALWRRWRGAWHVGLALAFGLGAYALVLIVMQASYGLIAAGHSGVSFGGLIRVVELALIGLGCPAVATLALLSPTAREAFEVPR
jgi:hypothetical protein